MRILRGHYKKFAPTTINRMTALDIGWIAGLFEGEGSFSYAGSSARLKISMVDRDVIYRIQETTGVGNINTAELSSGKTIYNWVVCKRYDLLHLLASILPLLSERRRARVVEILDLLDVPEYPVGCWTISPA